MDSQVHRRRAYRRLTGGLCALTVFGFGAVLRSSAEGTASATPTDCTAIEALFGPEDGQTPFRPLPVISPASGTLDLALRAVRPPGGVMIGDILVHGVPVFEIAPRAGSRITLVDQRTGNPIDMPATCLSSPRWAYGGVRWALTQGDRLKVRFTSALDFRKGEITAPATGAISCRAANLHTHGLLVSPYRTENGAGRATYGDYVFDAAAPSGDSASRDGDPCASSAGAGPMEGMTIAPASGEPNRPIRHQIVLGEMDYDTGIPGVAGQNNILPGGHPSGVFWFHPHPHGYTALLTSGGTSGMITVGNLADYACAKGVSDGCAPGAIPTRDLLLKDAQVVPDHGIWRLEYDRDYDLEDACHSGGAEQHLGECHGWRGDRWLFTINGQRDPVMSGVGPGQTEVWRIVNGSANVSYRLRLRPVTGGDALPFQILSLEGSGANPTGWAEPGRQNELLLMPAARAEIAITAPQVGGRYVLEQEGVVTGGDVWPAVTLAQVRFEGVNSVSPPILLHGPSAEKRPPEHFYPGPLDGCGFEAGEVRRIYFVKRPSFADERRRRDTFGLIAAVQKGAGPATMLDVSGSAIALNAKSWQALLASDAHAPAYMHNPSNTVCTYLGHTETWVLENDTDEAHNFHIHQSEFQLAVEHRGDAAFFSPQPATHDPDLAASDRAIASADGKGREAVEASLYHDTIPIPRGVSLGGSGCTGAPMNTNCRPGLVTVRIRFDRDEQIGDFVYHCHILQHEDDGMMAQIRVLCPPTDASCAIQHMGEAQGNLPKN